MTALDCFQFFIDKQKALKGTEPFDRLQVLPWEFLIYVVDHKTPLDEREWSIKNYLNKRPMIGKIYEEIVYDNVMLQTQSKTCKLNDKLYTLESIRKNGGVCAMQADFAARVSKNLIVPASYVWGPSQDLGLHAWVMWVEVRSTTGGKINFTLESHGRYLGDNYYTGKLTDPQTGQEILDRDMERRLSAVALDRTGKRQAELGMKYYDEICDYRKLDKKKKVLFLDRCLALCHFNETAWTELARQVKDGELDTEARQLVLEHLETMMKTFAKYPDYTWKIANDLIRIQANNIARNSFYERLTALYEKAGRPDLACEARLKWADFVVEDQKWMAASKGLSTTILKFPAEGRFIPKLVEKLADVCTNYKEGPTDLGKQYLDLLKVIPPKRGNDPSQYCIQMYEKAISFFKDQKKSDKTLKDLEMKLSALKGGKS